MKKIIVKKVALSCVFLSLLIVLIGCIESKKIKVTFVIAENNSFINEYDKGIITAPEQPTLDEHRFEYWEKDGIKYNFDISEEHDFTLHAKWTKLASFEIVVKDFDNSIIGQKKLLVDEYDSVFAALDDTFDCVSMQTEYGTYLSSIANMNKKTLVDPFYFIAIYENQEASSVGIDDLVIDEGDSFEFVVECWNYGEYGSFDEIDLLVNEALYHYFRYGSKIDVAASQATIAYDYLAVSKSLTNNFYDENEFSLNSWSSYNSALSTYQSNDYQAASVSDLFKGAILAIHGGLDNQKLLDKIPSLSSATIYDYWPLLAAQYLLDYDGPNFAAELAKFAGNLTDEWMIDDTLYQTALIMPLITNDIASLKSKVIKSVEDNWLKNNDATIGVSSFGSPNANTTALAICALIAVGEDPRSEKWIKNGRDLIEELLEFYLEDGLFKYLAADDSYNSFATKDVIFALASYKLFNETSGFNSLYAYLKQ